MKPLKETTEDEAARKAFARRLMYDEEDAAALKIDNSEAEGEPFDLMEGVEPDGEPTTKAPPR
jgi:hypothetical protein